MKEHPIPKRFTLKALCNREEIRHPICRALGRDFEKESACPEGHRKGRGGRGCVVFECFDRGGQLGRSLRNLFSLKCPSLPRLVQRWYAFRPTWAGAEEL